MVIMGRQVEPAGGDDVAKIIGMHLTFDNATEEAGAPLGANRDIVRPWPGVIVISQAQRLAPGDSSLRANIVLSRCGRPG